MDIQHIIIKYPKFYNLGGISDIEIKGLLLMHARVKE